jgi:two-component system, NarL family, invasion response regulator UvrY
MLAHEESLSAEGRPGEGGGRPVSGNGAHRHRGDPEPTGPVGVLAVDDDPRCLRLAAAVVRATPGFDFVGGAASGEEAVTLAARLRPHLVLMDVRMPGIGGIEAARRITEGAAADTTVVLMSADPTLLRAEDLPAAAAGVVRKERLSPRALRELWAD